MAFLFRICKIPYASEHIIRQIRSLEYLFCGFSYTNLESAINSKTSREEIAVPDSIPLCAPDSSNRDEYCPTLSGVNGGTLIGPLFWACRGWTCACAGAGAGGPVIPSNLGRGPPARKRAVSSHLCLCHVDCTHISMQAQRRPAVLLARIQSIAGRCQIQQV